MSRMMLIGLVMVAISGFSGYMVPSGNADPIPTFPGSSEDDGGEGTVGGGGPTEPPEEDPGEDDGPADSPGNPGGGAPQAPESGGSSIPAGTGRPALPTPPSPVRAAVSVVLTAQGADGNPTTAPSVGFTLVCADGSSETKDGSGEFVIGTCPVGSATVCSRVPDNWEPTDNCHSGTVASWGAKFDFNLRRVSNRAGYCDPKTWQFYDLVEGQHKTDPDWTPLNLIDARKDPVTGAIDCDFTKVQSSQQMVSSPAATQPSVVVKPKPSSAKVKSQAKAKPAAPALTPPVLTAPDPLSGQPHYRGACYMRSDGVLAFKGTDPGPGEGPALYTDVTGDDNPDSHCELNRLSKAERAAYLNRYFPKK